MGSVSAYLSISTTVEGNDDLMVCYPQDGWGTALILASVYGKLQIVKKLIKAGATVDQQSKVGIPYIMVTLLVMVRVRM